jgi:hypothetical protein
MHRPRIASRAKRLVLAARSGDVAAAREPCRRLFRHAAARPGFQRGLEGVGECIHADARGSAEHLSNFEVFQVSPQFRRAQQTD